MKKILLFIFIVFFSFTFSVDASENVGYCYYELELNDTLKNDHIDGKPIKIDLRMEHHFDDTGNFTELKSYFVVDGEDFLDNATTISHVEGWFGSIDEKETKWKISGKYTNSNNMFSCQNISYLALNNESFVTVYVPPYSGKASAADYLKVAEAYKTVEPNKAEVDELIYETSVAPDDGSVLIKFKLYESGNNSIELESAGYNDSMLFDITTPSEFSMQTGMAGGKVNFKKYDVSRVFEDMQDKQLDLKICVGYHAGHVFKIEDDCEDSDQSVTEENANTYNGDNFAKKLGALKNAVDQFSNLPGNISNFIIGTKTFNEYDSNDSLCTSSNCKENTEYYISSGIRDIITYCNNNIGDFLENNATDRQDECVDFIDFYETLIENGVINNIYGTCGFISIDLANFLNRILGYIAIFAPILAVLLGTVDFIKVIANGDAEKEMKSAFKKFMIRIGMAIALIIAPIIISFILNLFALNGHNSDNPFCGLEYSIKNIEDEK